MKILLKIFGRLIFYSFVLLILLSLYVLHWSYGEKKKIPPNVISNIERVLQQASPKSRVFIEAADVEFFSFSDGLGITLTNSYIRFGNNIVASVPQVKLKLKLYDLATARLKFREIKLEKPKFVISGNMGAQNFSESASRDFFEIYKNIIYSLFEKVDKKTNSIPVEKVDMDDAEFSFNNAGKYEIWNIDKANLRFFSLQDTTYLSTYVKTRLFNRTSEITVNARVLDEDKMMLKVDYSNLSSKIASNFVKGLGWFNELKPVLNGTSSIIMDKEGTSTTISLDTNVRFRKEEIKDTEIGLKGVLDLIQDPESKIIKPKVHGDVFLKDVDMKKLPILWPEEYGTEVRQDVLNNYTKGTFNNVEIGFDYSFSDPEFTKVESEKFSISGNIVATDVIYNSEFPTVEKADGRFYYDGNNVKVDLERGQIGKLIFLPTKINISGINDPKTIIELDGNAKGDLTSLRPLLASILKGRDKEFFYNTREMSSDSEIRFYYKDNINSGFDPEVLKMDIDAKLSNVEIKEVVKGVDLTSKNLSMKVDDAGLHIIGDANLNGSPSQIKALVGFVKENHVELNVVSETPTEILDKLVPGVANFADGKLEIEFEYKSEGERNYFAGKVDSIDAAITVPYLGWKKPTGTFASISFGGKYIADKAVDISELQIVSGKSISTGRMIVSLDPSVADEIYFNRLTLGDNDAEVFFNSTQKGKNSKAYVIKVNGDSFNASELLNSFKKITSGDNSMIFDMNVKTLTLANGITLKNTKANLRCEIDRCIKGNFEATIESGGNVGLVLKPTETEGMKGSVFDINTDNAGDIIKGFDISTNIEGGALSISGDIGGTAEGEANGIFLMTNFKLKQAPVITKILSLASFTGIIDLLSGSGVLMKKMKGYFKIRDNYLSLSNIKAYGDSLGFTLQGNINLDGIILDLSGAVTPSYSVNSFLGKVPILGGLFKGKEGEGLIATNYSVKGKYPKVDVSVNPFSALTPGFLRNIWTDAETDIDKKKKQGEKKTNVKQRGFPVNVKPVNP